MDTFIPFQYPEDREIKVGTMFTLDIGMQNNVEKKVKVVVTEIIKDRSENRMLFHCEQI